MTTYKVISGSVQYGRQSMKDAHGKVVYGKPLVADIGQTIDDKQISKESAARLVQLGVLQVVADVTDVEVKSETKATPKGAAKAQTKAAETKQPEAPADKVAESDVPAFLSGT